MAKRGEIDLPKLRYWKSVLADFERSGLTGQAYCREKGITYTAFANRRRKLSGKLQGNGRQETRSKKPTGNKRVCERNVGEQVEFAEVLIKPSLQSSAAADRLEVVLPTGTVLRVPAAYPVVDLAEVISALEGK